MTIIFNETSIKNFIIFGFPGLSSEYFGPVSALLLFVFLCVVGGNSLTISLIYFIKVLHKPRYIIFVNLAMTDMIFGLVTLPKIIARYWWGDSSVLFGACFAQMYFVHAMGAIHSAILLIMALDLFVAVWSPLQYSALVTNRGISVACSLCWIVTLTRMVGVTLHALTLPYCGAHGNVISHCFCNHVSLLSLSCGGEKIKEVKVVALGVALFVLLFPLSFILFSYFSVIVAVLRMPRTESRCKVLSTCTPQLFITCLYYVPRCFIYIANNLKVEIGPEKQTVIVMLYSLVPAMVNPLIYCFKTKDIKDTLTQRLKNRVSMWK